MASKMSTESCNSRFTADAGVLERYLELTKKCMERVQSMSSAPSGSTESPKFNSEQCEYIASKLRLAVKSADFFLALLNRGNVWLPSAEALANCLESFKLLYTLSEEVESFTRECCRDEWIHAALTLTNVSDHVSSMGFNLQLWSIFVSFESEKNWTQVDRVYNSEVEIVEEKALRDKETLSTRLDAVLRSTKRSSLEHHLAALVRDRLDGRLNPARESAGASQARFSEAVLRSMDQKKKLQVLGKGASAIVYKVTWSGAEYAVKTFFGPEDNTVFKKEVSVLRGLFHPNIVSVLCFGKERRKCSIVMEKMDDDLHSFMQARFEENRPPFGILEGVDIMLQIGRGMHYLHGLRIAHRDLKSSNILVRSVQATELETEYVMVKVSDFGLSKRDLKSMTYTPQTNNTGTSRWMAPELIKFADAESTTEGETLVKRFPLKCDIYSFAIVCYEILTGEHPFADIENLKEIKRLVLRGNRPSLPAGCPKKLTDLIERCWSSDAETRPNFGEICVELRHLKYLLTSSVVATDNSFLASSSFTALRSGFQLSHPPEVEQGKAQNPFRFHYLRNKNTATSRNVIGLVLPTVSAVPEATAMAVPVVDHCVDYLQQSISSMDVVLKLEKDLKVQLNVRQCQYLADKLTETGCFLRAKSDSLIAIHDSADIRRKALLQLHFAVKRAEKLVRGCCCEEESWLEAAVTLSHVKEDIKDILLDLRWWTSMLDIAIASVTWRSSGRTILVELLTLADLEYAKLLASLYTSDNGLNCAAVKDEDALLRKVREVETSFAGAERTAEQKHEYLLAVHVRSWLENSEVETVAELNEYDDANLIGMGGFGAVMNVRWMGRRCALKTLRQACKKEATSLREFQHPHIVKFFRYWEAPFRRVTPIGTPRGTPQGIPGSGSGQFFGGSEASHILMEVLPMDLSQHLTKLRNMANFTVGTKRKPEQTRGSPLPEDVALDVMLQTVKAMWHLNSKDVAHRDLKPNNVLVRPVSDDEVPELNYRGYLRVKLADFGLAKTKALSSALSIQQKNVGTSIYGAPEVFNKDIISKKNYPRKADVWSFGIMFCEVLTGKPPFPEVEDRRMGTGQLHKRITEGLRPKLPEKCPDYLRFIIESCWQLRPEDRPSFADLLRMMRLAQVRSLGLIQKDHDLFFYISRTGVKSLRPLKKISARAPPSPESFLQPQDLEGRLKQGSGRSRWWIMTRWLSSNLSGRRDLRFQPLGSTNWGFSRANEASTSRSQSECKPMGYLVNQTGPTDVDLSESKLDVIFFEGNVGRRKGMSCKDTWVQRDKPNVWWPRDWLPKDVGGDIRVLLLEYSISDDGVEGVLDQLQRLLVFSDRWNRKHTWERPIVLVGHSLGCVVIKRLVVALDKRAKSIQTLEDEVEIGRAKVAEAFLTSLAGCFFYAPPWKGLVPSEGLLEYVFGGLSYSRELFSDLCLDSPKLELLSEEFVRVKRKHMKLTAIIEGCHTSGRTVVPPTSMQGFEGKFFNLPDSNHTDVCKPTDKQHQAYKEVLKFVADIVENSKAIQYLSANEEQKLFSGKQQKLSKLSIGKEHYLSAAMMEYMYWSSGKDLVLSTGKMEYLPDGKEVYLSNDKRQSFSNGKELHFSNDKQPVDMLNR